MESSSVPAVTTTTAQSSSSTIVPSSATPTQAVNLFTDDFSGYYNHIYLIQGQPAYYNDAGTGQEATTYTGFVYNINEGETSEIYFTSDGSSLKFGYVVADTTTSTGSQVILIDTSIQDGVATSDGTVYGTLFTPSTDPTGLPSLAAGTDLTFFFDDQSYLRVVATSVAPSSGFSGSTAFPSIAYGEVDGTTSSDIPPAQ